MLMTACGAGGGGDDDGFVIPPPDDEFFSVSVIGGKDGITVIEDEDAEGTPTVRYLGQVRNETAVPACFLDISLSSLGEDGHSIDRGGTLRPPIEGFTKTNIQSPTKEELDNCLSPGQVGSFDTGEKKLTGAFADFEFKGCVQENSGQSQRCQYNNQYVDPIASLIVVGPEMPTANSIVSEDPVTHMVKVHGRVKFEPLDGPSQNLTALNIEVHFTFLEANDLQSKVVGTATTSTTQDFFGKTFLLSSSCNENVEDPLQDCLAHGGTTEAFSFLTDIPYEKTCAGADCSYWRIHHSE